MNYYTNGSSNFIPYDILVDPNGTNQYLIHAYQGGGATLHITQIYQNGSLGWSKEYTGFVIKNEWRSAQISGDGNNIFMIGGNDT